MNRRTLGRILVAALLVVSPLAAVSYAHIPMGPPPPSGHGCQGTACYLSPQMGPPPPSGHGCQGTACYLAPAAVSGGPTATIGAGSGNWERCIDVTTCSANTTTVATDSVLVVAVTVYGTTLTGETVAVHGLTLAEEADVAGSGTAPAAQLWAVLIASSATVKPYVNFTSATYYNVEFEDFTNTVYLATFISGTGTSQDTKNWACSLTTSTSNEVIVADIAADEVATSLSAAANVLGVTEHTTTDSMTMAWGYTQSATSGSQSVTGGVAASDAASMACLGLLSAAVPTAPTSLTFVSATTTTVSLSWTDTAAQSSYLTGEAVEQAAYSGTACGTFSASTLSSPTTTSATVTGLTSTSYYCFEVDVSNGTGASAYSTALSNILTSGGPLAPYGLTATPQSGTTSEILVDWTLPSGTLVNQTFVQSTGSTCSGSKTYTNFADGTTVSNLVSSLAGNTAYSFEIFDWTSGGQGQMSSCVTATTYGTPSAPTGLATTGTSTSSVSLSWVNPTGVGTIANDTMYAGLACNSWTLFYNLGVASAATISSLNPYTTYCFAVQAWTFGAGSPTSSSLSVTTLAGLPAATNYFAETSVTATAVSFSWSDPTPSTGSIVNTTLYYGSSCGAIVTGNTGNQGTWTGDVSLNSAGTTGTVSGLSSATSYCFGIALWTQGGQGPQSETNATTGNAVPSAPSGLTYLSASHTTVTMVWTQATGIVLYDSVSYTTVAACASGLTTINEGLATTVTVGGLSSATSYYWEVDATSSGGTGSYSSCVTGATESATPPAPYDLSNQLVTATSVYVLWTNPSGYSLTDNIVYVSTANGACGTWSQTNDIGIVSTAYHVTGLTASARYCIEVTAVDAQSNYSLPLFVTTAGNGGGTGFGLISPADDWVYLGLLLVVVCGVLIFFAVPRRKKGYR